MTEIVTYSKHIRISPKKIHQVARVISGLSPSAALQQLAFLKKGAAGPLAETLKSALANAENNFKIVKENLKIKKIEVSSGPALKRFRAISRGAAHSYKRRTTHVKMVLEEIEKAKENKKSG